MSILFCGAISNLYLVVSDLVIEVAMHQLDLGSNHLLLSYTKYLPKNTFAIVFIYVMSCQLVTFTFLLSSIVLVHRNFKKVTAAPLFIT